MPRRSPALHVARRWPLYRGRTAARRAVAALQRRARGSAVDRAGAGREALPALLPARACERLLSCCRPAADRAGAGREARKVTGAQVLYCRRTSARMQAVYAWADVRRRASEQCEQPNIPLACQRTRARPPMQMCASARAIIVPRARSVLEHASAHAVPNGHAAVSALVTSAASHVKLTLRPAGTRAARTSQGRSQRRSQGQSQRRSQGRSQGQSQRRSQGRSQGWSQGQSQRRSQGWSQGQKAESGEESGAESEAESGVESGAESEAESEAESGAMSGAESRGGVRGGHSAQQERRREPDMQPPAASCCPSCVSVRA
eukprot:365107-Chlamydomonas_euryale.AAC.3